MIFTQVIIWKCKTDGRTDGRMMEGLTDTWTSNLKQYYPATIVWWGVTKTEEATLVTSIFHSKPMGPISCHSNQSSEAIFLKCISKHSPTKDML